MRTGSRIGLSIHDANCRSNDPMYPSHAATPHGMHRPGQIAAIADCTRIGTSHRSAVAAGVNISVESPRRVFSTQVWRENDKKSVRRLPIQKLQLHAAFAIVFVHAG